MRILLLILYLVSFNTQALTPEQDAKLIQLVVDTKNKGYSDKEIKFTLLSNTFVTEKDICDFLISECEDELPRK